MNKALKAFGWWLSLGNIHLITACCFYPKRSVDPNFPVLAQSWYRFPLLFRTQFVVSAVSSTLDSPDGGWDVAPATWDNVVTVRRSLRVPQLMSSQRSSGIPTTSFASTGFGASAIVVSVPNRELSTLKWLFVIETIRFVDADHLDVFWLDLHLLVWTRLRECRKSETVDWISLLWIAKSILLSCWLLSCTFSASFNCCNLFNIVVMTTHKNLSIAFISCIFLPLQNQSTCSSTSNIETQCSLMLWLKLMELALESMVITVTWISNYNQ